MAFKLYDSNRDVIGNMTDVITTSDGEILITLDTGHKFQFRANDISWDTVRNAYIKKNGSYHQDALDNARYYAQARAILNTAYAREAAAMNAAVIKNVIFAPPATIVYWSDGSKTVVKCNKKDIFDPEKGLAMAIAKRCGGNKGNYYKEIQNWVEKSGKKYPGKLTNQETAMLCIPPMIEDLEELIKSHDCGNVSMMQLHMTELRSDLEILKAAINK